MRKHDIRSKSRRAAAALISLVMVLVPACPAFAAASSPKEEVIYVKIDASGAQKSVNAVNIFGTGSITDYGDYSEVRLMNSNEDISLSGDTVTFTTEGSRVYYQGTMDPATEIPWNISIRYYLGGAEVTPEELAGSSGSLAIRFTAENNPACSSVYFDNYAVQATFLLDTEKCSNIYAPDATAANVGSNKQLTYTVLPGRGIDTTISAQVRDFEMEAVSINGIALNLNIDLDDEELLDKVRELMTAVRKLNNGAAELAGGAYDARSGAGELLNGSADLYSGVGELDSGVKSLQSGMVQMQSGLDELESKVSDLRSGSAQIKAALAGLRESLGSVSADTEQLALLSESAASAGDAISALKKGMDALYSSMGYAQYKAVMKENGLDIDELTENNENMAGALAAAAAALESSDPAMSAQLKQAAKLLAADNAALSGVDTYLSGLSSNAGTIDAGLTELDSKYTQLSGGISSMIGTLSEMAGNLAALKEAVETLESKYGDIDSGVSGFAQGIEKLIGGYSDLVSGVSSLASGSSRLLDGAGALKQGTADLYDGVSELCDGAEKLANGTEKLNSKTSDMDDQVQDEIDGILESLGGDDFEAVSFTSEKNTDVKSVQFVIRTDPIETAKADAEDTQEEEDLTVLRKFLRLFTPKGE